MQSRGDSPCGGLQKASQSGQSWGPTEADVRVNSCLCGRLKKVSSAAPRHRVAGLTGPAFVRFAKLPEMVAPVQWQVNSGATLGQDVTIGVNDQ